MLREPKGDRCSDRHCFNRAPLQTPDMRLCHHTLRTAQTDTHTHTRDSGERRAGWRRGQLPLVGHTSAFFLTWLVVTPGILLSVTLSITNSHQSWTFLHGSDLAHPFSSFLLGLMLQMFDLNVTHAPTMIAAESTGEIPNVSHCGEDKHALHEAPLE